MEKTVEVVVVGAGLTGLTTAFYLKKKQKSNPLPWDIIILPFFKGEDFCSDKQ